MSATSPHGKSRRPPRQLLWRFVASPVSRHRLRPRCKPRSSMASGRCGTMAILRTSSHRLPMRSRLWTESPLLMKAVAFGSVAARHSTSGPPRQAARFRPAASSTRRLSITSTRRMCRVRGGTGESGLAIREGRLLSAAPGRRRSLPDRHDHSLSPLQQRHRRRATSPLDHESNNVQRNACRRLGIRGR